MRLITIVMLVVLGSKVSAQTIVDTSAQNKKVILEVYRGSLTPFGGFADHMADTLRAKDSSVFTIINSYEGFYAGPRTSGPYYFPDYRSSFGSAIQTEAGVSIYPSGSVNRSLFPSLNVNSNTAMARNLWEYARDTILNQPSPVNVGVVANYNAQTNVITATAEVYFTDTVADSMFVNIGFKQNNVIGPQLGDTSRYPARYGNDISIYRHGNILRHLLTGQWGEYLDSITYQKGTLWAKTYTWTVPDSIAEIPVVPADLDVFAFVSEYRDSVLTVSSNPVNMPNNAMSGIYTIGGTSPDFTTISQAVDSLKSKGVSGPVTFHIRQGTYNEQLSIGKIAGVSASNTVTFKTDPSSSSFAELTYGTTYIVQLKDSVSFLKFDSLKFNATGSGTNVFRLDGVTSNITISNDSLLGSTNSRIIEKVNTVWGGFLTITNNYFTGAIQGVYSYGNSSTKDFGGVINDNVFDDLLTHGVYVYNRDSVTISNNRIRSSGISSAGIALYRSKTSKVTYNEIYVGRRAIYYSSCGGTSTNRSLVANNIFSSFVATSSNLQSYYSSFTSNSFADVVFNSFYGKAISSSLGLVEINSGSNFTFKNNSIVNDTAGYALKVQSSNGHDRDYNNLLGNNGLNNIIGESIGSNSISINPDYISVDNLRTSYVKLVGRGVTISGISDDIDGTTRKSSPDIGAFENTPPLNNIGISDIDVPLVCAGDTAEVFVTLENFGSNTISSCTVNWLVSANGGAFISQTPYNYSGSLTSFSTTTLQIGEYVFSQGNSYSIKIYTSAPNSGSDTVNYNDTLVIENIGTALNGIYTIGGASPDFSSVDAAVSKVIGAGVCGPVIFNLRPGTYNEQISFRKIPGGSSINTVTLKTESGSNGLAKITFNSDYIFELKDSASHIIIDSLNLTATGSGTGVFLINGVSSDISITNDSIFGSPNSRIIEKLNSSFGGRLTIQKNYFSGGVSGVYIKGISPSVRDKGASIEGNTFNEFFGDAVYIYYRDSVIIDNNSMISSQISSQGISIYQCYFSKIRNNEINVGRKGIYASGFNGNSSYRSIISNNIFSSSVYTSSNPQTYSSKIEYNNYIDIFFNSFSGGLIGSTRGLVELTGGTSLEFKNNTIYNDSNAFALKVTSATSHTRDYNNLYGNNGSSNITGGTLGSNSITLNPNYYSSTNLRLTDSTLIGKGTPISGITLDIDSNTRLNPPTIGATRTIILGPMEGVYTVGGTASNYSTITAAVSDLVSRGVKGPVTFNIRSGTYAGQLEIDSIAGASAINTVTFQSDPSNASRAKITASSSNTVTFDGADYVTLKNLELQNSSSFGDLIEFNGYSDYLTIDSCKLVKTVTSGAIIYNRSSDTNIVNHLSVINNDVYCGDGAFVWANVTSTVYEVGHIYRNNNVQELKRSSIQWAMRFKQHDSLVIEHNKLVFSSATNSQSAISIFSCKNAAVRYNEIVANTSADVTGIFFSVSGGIREIIGNTYRNMKTSGVNQERGIQCNIGDADIYFNTVKVNSSTGVALWGYFFNTDIKNNNLVNLGGPTISLSGSTTGFSSNHNNFFYRDTLGFNSTTPFLNLNSWKTTFSVDNNSYEVDPKFESDSVLKPTTFYLNDAGTSITGVTEDITGTTRGSSPDIGAYEFFAADPRLSGTYTIGGTTPTFANFTEAVDSLNEVGVKGPVVFNVRAGTYSEQIEIDSIVGGSEVNTVTFQKDPGAATVPLLTFSSSNPSKPYTINFSSCDNLIIKGLYIKATGSRANALYYSWETENVLVDSCTIEGRSGVTGNIYNVVVFLQGNMHKATNCAITNSEIVNGYYGVEMKAANTSHGYGNRLINNQIRGFLLRGVELYNQDSVTVSDNNILATNTTTWAQTGVVSFFGGAGSSFISNKIELSTTKNSFGFQLLSTSGTSGNEIEFINNSFVNNTPNANSANERGFQFSSCNHLKIYHNTVLVRSSDIANGTALQLIGGSNFDVTNNNFVNTGGGYAVYASNPSNWTSSSNNYFTTGTKFNYFGFQDQNNLTAWNTATSEDSARNLNPFFLSNDSLVPNNALLNNLGEVISGITTDLNGTLRNATAPDIGAHEFTGVLPPLEGVYTVGGTTPDFNNLDTAVSALVNRGVSDSVWFDIRPGTYDAQYKLTAFGGMSTANAVQFRKDPNSTGAVTLKASGATSSANYILWLDSVSNLTFSNLRFDTNAVNNNRQVYISGISDSITIDSCYFNARADIAIESANDSTDRLNYFTLSNSTISKTRGSGISLGFGRNNKILNNRITGFGLNGGSGIYFPSISGKWTNDSIQIIGNYIKSDETYKASSQKIFGIEFNGGRYGKVSNNEIYIKGAGKRMAYGFNGGCRFLTITNNVISVTGKVTQLGRAFYAYPMAQSDVYYNTFYLNVTDTAGDDFSNPTFTGANPGVQNNVKNNIFVNMGAGNAIVLGTSSTTSDYNNIYAKSQSLSAWQNANSGWDVNSDSLNPLFCGDTLIPGIRELIGTGSPIAGYTTDILDSTRNASTPTVGAYEYTYECRGLAGTYTIGGTSPDYTSISEAVEELNCKGICDSVFLNIRSGTYNEQLEIKELYNAGDSGIVVFRTDPATSGTATITFSSSTIELTEGANNVRFDNLNIQASTSKPISIQGSIHDIYFNNDSISSPVLSSSSGTNALVATVGNTNSVNNFGFIGCDFVGGNMGINIVGPHWHNGQSDTNLVIKNCTFNAISGTQLRVSHSVNLKVIDNAITKRLISGGGAFYAAMQLYAPKGVTFTGNKIILEGKLSNSQVVSTRGLTVQYATTFGSQRSIFANNTIALPIKATGASNYAANFLNCGGTDVVFNSFYGRSIDTSEALVGLKNSSVNFNNNNVYNDDASWAIRVDGGSSALSYNNIYGNSGAMNLTGASQTAGGLNLDPYFLADTLPKPYRLALSKKGQTTAGFSDDIDGTSRTNPPDMGAYEFDPIVFDVAVDSISIDTLCSGTQQVRAYFRNIGDSVVKKIAFRVSSLNLTNLSESDSVVYYSGNLAKNEADSAIVGYVDFSANTNFEIIVSADTMTGSGSRGYRDNDPSDNVILDTISILPAPLADFTVAKACEADSLVLIPSGGVDYSWTGPGSYTDTLDTLIRTFADSNAAGEYTLTVYDSSGCTAQFSDSIVLDSAINVGLAVDDSICASTPYVISANANNQYAYSWNNGETTPSITAADSTFEYVLFVTDQNNCINSDTFKLTVFDEPNVRFDSTIEAACAFGDSIVLNHAKPLGGIYSGTNVNSAQSKLGPGTFGNYPVNYAYTDSNGCSGSADTVVVINKNPAVNLTNMADLCINSGLDTITENSPQDTLNGYFTGNGIINDSIGVFNPIVAGQGEHNIIYTYTNPLTGCFSSDSNTIVVNDTFAISFANTAEYCINGGKVTLENAIGLPPAYSSLFTGSNAGLFGSRGFNPQLAGVGSDTFLYTVTDTNNCISTADRVVAVDSIPLVTLSDTFFCFNASDLILTGGLPAGGNYLFARGLLNTTGSYSPGAAGTGLDTVQYAYTNAAGCSDTAVEVYQTFIQPTVTFSLPANNLERCIDAEPFKLTGQSPIDTSGSSQFSGLGLDGTNTKFVASNAGVGDHIIKFEYTDLRGCSDSAFDTVTVHALPIVTLLTPRDSVCVNELPDTLLASPINGTFSGVGVSNNGYFDASLVGVTQQNIITYSYMDSNGCVNAVVDTFKIDSITPITLSLIPDNCVNIDLDTLNQGSINSGDYLYKSSKLGDLVNGLYQPSLADTGIDNITYSYTNQHGCVDSLTQAITIHDTVSLSFEIPAIRNEVCENEATFNLAAGAPSGGNYSALSGNGLVGNKFSPRNALLGSNIIEYTYSDTNNCVSKILDTIVVNAITPVTHLGDTFCINEGLQLMQGGSIATGDYRYAGSGMLNDSIFSPVAAGIGSKSITYFFTNADGCISQASATYAVNSAPSTQFGALSPVCLNTDTFTLKGASTSGSLSYFYNSTGLIDSLRGSYLPSNASVGNELIAYVGVNTSTGCSDTVFQNLTILSIPNTVLDTFPDFCVNEDPIQLTQGSPTAGGTGVYSGPGIVGAQFYPNLAKAGNHVITYKFTAANSCTVSDTELVIVHALPSLTPALLPDFCYLDAPDTLTGALPAGGYYTGVGVDSATARYTPDSIGVWSITYHYTDGNGCSNSIAQNQQVRALPNTRLSFSDKFCDNDDPVTLNGGTPLGTGGSYFGKGVSGNVYDPRIVNDTLDTLVYTYTDIYGCSNSDSVIIAFDNVLTVTALTLPDLCKGTASLDLTNYYSPAGGSFSGNNVFAGVFISGLLDTGSYNFTYNYLDTNNCVASYSDSVIVRPNPSFAVSQDTGICQGDQLVLEASGSFSYNWSNGDYLPTTQVSPNRTTSYSVKATNTYNCSTSKTVAVTVYDKINVYTSSTPAQCGTSNGTAFTSVTGGTKPYNYVWSNGNRTSNSRELFPGNYQVTVSDKNGCTQYGSVGVNALNGPEITTIAKEDIVCSGESNGSIEVSIQSDTTYTLVWNNGAKGTKLENLAAGLYELSVLGDDGCNSFRTFEIIAPEKYTFTPIVSSPDCDSTNGSIALVVNNSLDSLSYNWLGQPIGDTLNNIGAGSYQVVVSNSNSCTDTLTYSIQNVNAPQIKLDSIAFEDCGQGNGLLHVSGIDSIQSFIWSNGATSGLNNNLAIGTYSVTATDTANCKTVEQYAVEGNAPNTVQLCTVTNDSLLDLNVLKWDTTGLSGVDSFRVYRESGIRNQFFELASVSNGNAPLFVDSALDNSSIIGKYRITGTDACGNESKVGATHQSILLNSKQTDSTLIELNWNAYKGYAHDKYYVYRYTSDAGVELLDSLNSIFSYIDYNAPLQSSILYYYIGIKGQTLCSDTGVTAISNLTRDYGRKLVGVAPEELNDLSFLVWPNPNRGTFNIKVKGIASEQSQISVFDMQGKVLYQNDFASNLLELGQSIFLPQVNSGMYYIQLLQNNTVITREIVINR